MRRLIMFAAVIFLIVGISFSASADGEWKNLHKKYYLYSSSVLSAQVCRYPGGDAYRFSIDLTIAAGYFTHGTVSGTFSVGTTLTGGDSGETAVIDTVVSDTKLYVSGVSGQFAGTEVIANTDSSATLSSIDISSIFNAKIFIPADDITHASIIFNAETSDWDSIFANIEYGIAFDAMSSADFITIETLKDSSNYWYKTNTVRELEIRAGYLPAPYLVIEVKGEMDDHYTGKIEFLVFVTRRGGE